MTGDERHLGYADGLLQCGLEADPLLDVRGVDRVATGRSATAALLDSRRPPDAIVACSDLLAIGALQAAEERGVAVGRELAVIGYDDSPVAPFLNPPLASVRQPLEDVAAAVVAQVVDRIENVGRRQDSRLLPPELIVRASA